MPSLQAREMFIKHSFFIEEIEKIDVFEIFFSSPPETTTAS